MKTVFGAILLALLATIFCCAQDTTCANLDSAIQSTYNFKPSKLTDSQRKARAVEMDKVWNLVEASSTKMLPCLVARMEDPNADTWFLYDAGALVASHDHSARTNALVLRGCEQVDLADADLEDWIHRLTRLALQDVDIAAAAERWLRYPGAAYVVPQHAFTVRREEGAFFLYGSMREDQATQALVKIASDKMHPARELALSFLSNLATPESDSAFRAMDLGGFPARAQTTARAALANRPKFQPRNPPKSTREQIMAMLQPAADQGDFSKFLQLSEEISDGERDVVTVMGPSDLPLLRKVRRAMAASGNPHLMEVYPYFTGIILTIQNRK
jgi:hypothetical protein